MKNGCIKHWLNALDTVFVTENKYKNDYVPSYLDVINGWL